MKYDELLAALKDFPTFKQLQLKRDLELIQPLNLETFRDLPTSLSYAEEMKLDIPFWLVVIPIYLLRVDDNQRFELIEGYVKCVDIYPNIPNSFLITVKAELMDQVFYTFIYPQDQHTVLFPYFDSDSE